MKGCVSLANIPVFEQITSDMIENKVRSFSMYMLLEKPLLDFLNQGDGLYALAVFNEVKYPDSPIVDTSLINFVKFLATAFGRARLTEACKIIEQIHKDNPKKRTFRFRSAHPLFIEGRPKYQNICLVSGMVHLGIPILPYFDGVKVLKENEKPSNFLKKLRKENPDLFL